jgi:DNA mismatch repair protein MutL
MGHVVDGLSSMAMGWHAVHFKLLHDGKTVKSWPSVVDPMDRIADVVGRDIGSELTPVTFKSQHIFLSGWISSPRIVRSSFRSVYVFVNGRYVRSRLIQHALMAGYEQKLVKGQFPVAVLFVVVPVESVDVNVHPTKHEIRFFDDRGVYEAVAAAVSDTLVRNERPGWANAESSENRSGEMKSAVLPTDSPARGSEKIDPADRPPAFAAAGRSMDLPVSPTEVREQALIWEKKQFRDLRVIGQLHNTYILCESVDGLILIDQHAAHERVLFEQLKARASAGRMATQRLLIPDVMDLGYNEAAVLERLIPELCTFGFEIEPFGGHTFIVKAVPFLLASKEIKPLIIEMIEKIIEIGFQTSLEKSIEECLTIMACHGAIRANQPLSGSEITALLQELDICENPAHCPHGRPIWIRWSSRFLDKSFKRIV